ncbi:tetratricopeptide repeat protein [candidate division KSB1 bacterium]|nr:tetratricopeptide repeat protein [candidate division KSB1 bacterium]
MKKSLLIMMIIGISCYTAFCQTDTGDSLMVQQSAQEVPRTLIPSGHYAADSLFNYLKEIHTQNDKHLREYRIDEYWRFITHFPESRHAPEVTVMMGQTHLDESDEAEAVCSYLRALFLYPTHPLHSEYVEKLLTIIPEWRVDVQKANKLQKRLGKSFKIETEATRLYDYISYLYHFDEDDFYEWTIRESRHFLNRFRTDSRIDSVMSFIGDIYFRMGDEREAVAAYSKLIFVTPNSPIIPYINYRSAVLLSSDMDEHQRALDKLSETALNYPESDYAAAAYMEAGKIKKERTKDYVGAIEEYRKLVERYPTHENAINVMFYIAEIQEDELDNHNAAIATYEEIITRFQPDTRCIKAMEEMADIYEDELDDYYKSAESYARIAEVFPAYEKAPEMLLKAGEICEDELDDYRKAIEYYQLVLDKFPEHKEVREAEKKIIKATEKIDENMGENND